MKRYLILAAMGVALATTGAKAQSTSSSTPAQAPPQPNSPYAEMREVPRAAAAAAAARGEYRKARSQIHFAILDLTMDLEQSPEWGDATLALNGAHRDYTHARNRVLTILEKDPDYQRASATEAAYALMIAELQTTPEPDSRTLMELAKQRLDAGMKVSAMKSEALEKDQAFLEARKALVQANNQVSSMRQALARSIRQDANWRQARTALLDARVDVAATAAYLNGAIGARDIAVDFASYQVHQLRYRPTMPDYSVGYGTWTSGYRLGYPIYWQQK